ncbi:hypothetical protein O181_088380 [Austropuccinia psidii MF-1]|uniref:Uncharacterized protein n=1 Tax=Austropuccinia psidii MF-1 TaxID=1389203 RepID=A0A9Q3IRS1_9BASI|nr:hypothetical protein [Austropuccinia psidii MF-1]
MQLQHHHMTVEVYELLKEINMNNCVVNDIGMESGDFPQTTNAEEDETSNTEIPVQTEDIGDENGQLPSECGDALRINTIDNQNQDAANDLINREGQSSSMSVGTSRRDQNFMNNMNTNMQNVLSPLMLMLQQSQDRAEERDRMQRARDEERQMLMREREEERRLRETQIRAEERRRNDQMNMYMMAMLSKMTGVPLDDPPANLRMGE